MKTSIILALAASTATAQIIVGTNSFDVFFEATNLSSAAQSRIISDMNLCRQLWTNSVVLFDESNAEPYISNRYVLSSPYYDDSLEFPDTLATNQLGILSLKVEKSVSDAYLKAFEFVDSNSNIIAAAEMLVDALSNTNIIFNTVEELGEYIFISSDKTVELPTDFKGFAQSAHSMPSVLAFGYETIDSEISTGSASNLIMKLQYRYKKSVDQRLCIWHDGKWKLDIWEWIQ
jgi:hypothetical protein